MTLRLPYLSAVALFLVVGFAAPTAAQTLAVFKSGEQTTGMTKQCFYGALGGVYTRTVSVGTLCPGTLRVSTLP
jgi:hypothetical protein